MTLSSSRGQISYSLEKNIDCGSHKSADVFLEAEVYCA
jgi:hypothetical protein